MSRVSEPQPYVIPTRTCPTSVVLASRTLAAMALLLVAELVVIAWDLVTIRSTVHRLGPTVGATTDAMDHLASGLTSYDILLLGSLLLLVAILMTAAVYARLGRRAGQALGITASVPLLACLPSDFLPSTQSQLETAVFNAEPGWAVSIDYAVLAVSPLAVLVIIALLTASSRRWFAMLPPAPDGYMWVPAQVADRSWPNWPTDPPAGRR